MTYQDFFKQATGFGPHSWQENLARETECCDRLIPVGTGLGKTLSLMLAWYYNRVVLHNSDWPRRLIWCLPMRVLVEQTLKEFNDVCARLAIHSSAERVPTVHGLMGGMDANAGLADADAWHLHPERNAIAVGTQDVLLSRSLGRGYGAARGRWPIDFGLLQSDCLWVFDEVQLMGVGALTGAQLQAFRNIAVQQHKMARPSHTWFASATLRDRWLATVDSWPMIEAAKDAAISVADADKSLEVYEAEKPLTVEKCHGKLTDVAGDIAKLAITMHGDADAGPCVTLVVLNRVDDATKVFARIRQDLAKDSKTDVRLVHSRFRGRERQRWGRGEDGQDFGFLSRKACEDTATNRIVVATQVIEAGVDISAGSIDGLRGGLVTENAPMSSLVQRFGRAARYGGKAKVTVIDRGLTAKDALPYDEDALDASLEALAEMQDVGLKSLETADAKWQQNPALDERLFQLEFQHLLTEPDFLELFDTTPDLTGDDIDISRFIREGDERNAQVCWFRPPPEAEPQSWAPPSEFTPDRLDLCPAPFISVRSWLIDAKNAGEHRKVCAKFAYVWDYEDGRWRTLRNAGDIVPGTVVLVDARIGGYDVTQGFVGTLSKAKGVDAEVVDAVDFGSFVASADAERLSNAAASREQLSVTNSYQSIAEHGHEVGTSAKEIAAEVGLRASWIKLLEAAGHWHDWGKCHPAFQANIVKRSASWQNRDDIAKAPGEAWLHYRQREFNWPELAMPERFGNQPLGKRTGFRHELASALGILELLRRRAPAHEAILGGDEDLADSFGAATAEALVDPSIADSLVNLDADELNLLLYLVASHHGKVRCALLRTPADEEFVRPQSTNVNVGLPSSSGGNAVAISAAATLPIRGVCSGDKLPAIELRIGDGPARRVPEITLHTDVAAMGWGPRYGASWSQRVLELMESVGPFDLALMEAILRAADVLRSSAAAVRVVGDTERTQDITSANNHDEVA